MTRTGLEDQGVVALPVAFASSPTTWHSIAGRPTEPGWASHSWAVMNVLPMSSVRDLRRRRRGIAEGRPWQLLAHALRAPGRARGVQHLPALMLIVKRTAIRHRQHRVITLEPG